MKPARILVVDDDDHVREALVDELSDEYDVEAVRSGGEAFDALVLHEYDVVISDLKMPDRDGIEVLEFARAHQRDVVRVLLTGYLDADAQRALMSPDAPYKVGKPWHDEIEIAVRRGLEQRAHARRLTASIEDALSLADFDRELATTRSRAELAETVVRRALTVEGITACGAIHRDGEGERELAGGAVPRVGLGWYVDIPLDPDGDLRLRARGVTDSARSLVEHMAHRAQRVAGVLEARAPALQSAIGTGTRVNQLLRQATLGALTSSLLHDLASTMQALSSALDDVTELAAGNQPGLADAVADATTAGEAAVQLFVQMRRFIQSGEVQLRPTSLRRLIERVVRLVGGHVRERAQLRIGELPDVRILVSEPLFVQVLANLLRNAANASPVGGFVDLSVRVASDEVVVTVVDDGPGVAPEIADTMFEPFASTRDDGSGLGLAISASVMQMLGGRISYHRDATRGACFSTSVRLEAAASKAG